MINGDNFDDGSSTESEYYEDAIDEVPACGLLDAALFESPVHEPFADHAAGIQAHNLKQTKKSEAHESERLQAFDTSIDGRMPPHSGSLQADSDTVKPKHETTTCGCCRASVTRAPRATAFQRAHRLCHCCKVSMGTINRGVVHKTNILLRLRFCAPCFDANGSEFVANVRTARPPVYTKCSGCQHIKHRNRFHCRQRIFWHWEEPLGHTHYCFQCLPKGFQLEEDRIMPMKLWCTECAKIKHRDGFSRSLKERVMSSEDFEQFEQCVKDSLVVCNLCLDLRQLADDLLVCSRCERSLDRSKFSLAQQRVAKREDEGFGHLQLDIQEIKAIMLLSNANEPVIWMIADEEVQATTVTGRMNMDTHMTEVLICTKQDDQDGEMMISLRRPEKLLMLTTKAIIVGLRNGSDFQKDIVTVLVMNPSVDGHVLATSTSAADCLSEIGVHILDIIQAQWKLCDGKHNLFCQ